jgi:hypothetical protein
MNGSVTEPDREAELEAPEPVDTDCVPSSVPLRHAQPSTTAGAENRWDRSSARPPVRAFDHSARRSRQPVAAGGPMTVHPRPIATDRPIHGQIVAIHAPSHDNRWPLGSARHPAPTGIVAIRAPSHDNRWPLGSARHPAPTGHGTPLTQRQRPRRSGAADVLRVLRGGATAPSGTARGHQKSMPPMPWS